ncbi:TerB N-terminal domain-containing protein [Atopobium fossor]|uniref:TerB N-terminal domain-containing protein n=1 Tax=Atopobium fossor TaxID=39487 RepID=UPI0004243AB7|nr:TerB N-terminal domain-containing protein [Atopobium fossor]
MYEKKPTYPYDHFESAEHTISRAVDIARDILAQITAGESSVFSQQEYRDTPILRTGRQLLQEREKDVFTVQKSKQQLARYQPIRQEPTPQRILEMRGLATQAGWHSYHYGGSKLFYEQALFMADFEDDCDYASHFSCYYPTYEDMSNLDARAYFSWRTQFRKCKISKAPLSFLFVYAYELLCGVGVESAQQAMDMLAVLCDEYCKDETNKVLQSYLRSWMLDLALWHGLPLDYACSDFVQFAAVHQLRELEQKLVQGKLEAPQINASKLFDLLCAVSQYHLEKSKLYATHPQKLQQVCTCVFVKMVEHCKTRRKTGYIDGLFGPPVRDPYAMFSGAIFYTPQAHENQVIVTPWHVVYSCRNGRWTISKPCKVQTRSSELGNLLHEIDAVLREALGDSTSLKPREIPKYQRGYITQEIIQLVNEKKRIEAARIVINKDSLHSIRTNAAQTREALLVDEEREFIAESELSAKHIEEPTPNTGILSNWQKELLESVLENKPMPQIQSTIMLSVEVDRINELLYEQVYDAVLEFDGQVVSLVEDYRKDVEEFVRAN